MLARTTGPGWTTSPACCCSSRASICGGATPGETVCLALEVIENHAYERSRFLRSAAVNEANIEREAAAVIIKHTRAASILGPGARVQPVLNPTGR
jgi:hypothetical protein